MNIMDKFKSVVNEQPLYQLRQTGGWFNIKIDVKKKEVSFKNVGGPISGARATVETEGEIRDRFTATRILALGVFALAFKKKTADKDVFIVIEHPDYVITTDPIPSKREQKAREFARKFNEIAGTRNFVRNE